MARSDALIMHAFASEDFAFKESIKNLAVISQPFFLSELVKIIIICWRRSDLIHAFYLYFFLNPKQQQLETHGVMEQKAR